MEHNIGGLILGQGEVCSTLSAFAVVEKLTVTWVRRKGNFTLG